MNDVCNVLLIEDNLDDRIILREMLCHSQIPYDKPDFHIDEAHDLMSGLDAIESRCYDVILLDLRLPDSIGLDGFRLISARAPNRPVIILAELHNGKSALAAVGEGAQDYIVKSEVNAALLVRSIHYAMQRQRRIEEKQVIIDKLSCALNDLRKLQKLVPICHRCGRIREDEGYWSLLESYKKSDPELRQVQGLCPECENMQFDN